MFVARNTRSMLVVVALVAFCGPASAHEVCNTKSAGQVSPPAFPVKLQDVYLPPGIPDFSFEIIDPVCPQGTYHVGTVVQVCDEGVAPDFTFYNIKSGHIHRHNPVSTGRVRSTAYCLPYSHRRSGSASATSAQASANDSAQPTAQAITSAENPGSAGNTPKLAVLKQ